MNAPARWGSTAAWIVLVVGVGARGAQDGAAPSPGNEAERTEASGASAAAGAAKHTPHEALLARPRDRAPVFADRVPPPPITERPGDAAPSNHFQWIRGYWDWDPAHKEYVWVTGAWRVPPPGKFWVEGFWRKVNGQGWARVPGFWSERKDRPAPIGAMRVARDWRRLGPPPTRPLDTVDAPPAPDFFYIPGEFIPDGEAVVWRPGFWYHVQPGWEWNPAHWTRQASGWTFREGSWRRIDGMPAGPPQGDSLVRRPTITSTAASPSNAPAPYGVATNPFMPAGMENRPGMFPGATVPASNTPGTMPPGATDAAPGDPDVDTAAAEEEHASAEGTTPPDGKTRAETPAPAGTPTQNANQSRYYYPQQWNYPGWGVPRFGVGGYLRQFLPF
jgi:hypothetical protein